MIAQMKRREFITLLGGSAVTLPRMPIWQSWPNHIAWSFYGGETYIRLTIPERIGARCRAGAGVVHELLLIINRVGCWQRGLPRPT
jgi:hypothetical protein